MDYEKKPLCGRYALQSKYFPEPGKACPRCKPGKRGKLFVQLQLAATQQTAQCIAFLGLEIFRVVEGGRIVKIKAE